MTAPAQRATPRFFPDELPRNYFTTRLDARTASELVGMARGLICDRVIYPGEFDGLARWLERHPDAQAHFPGREIAFRLYHIYLDGVIDDFERREFLDYLIALVGDADAGLQNEVATRLPLDDPPPTLTFVGQRFVLTGVFAHGTRRECEALTESLGGACAGNLSRKVDYLVVGSCSSDAWITSAYGRKIERAVALRAEHGAPAIVTEAHWLERAMQSPGASDPSRRFNRR